MTLQAIIGVTGLILAFINLLLISSLRDTSSKLTDWEFYIVLLYVILLPFVLFFDLQKQIPAGVYSIPCKVTVEERNYYTGNAKAIIRVDEYDDMWISDVTGIENSGLHFVSDWTDTDLSYSQTIIRTELYDLSDDYSYDAKIEIKEIKAGRLGVSFIDSIKVLSLYEKILYLLMIAVAAVNLVSIFTPRHIEE